MLFIVNNNLTTILSLFAVHVEKQQLQPNIMQVRYLYLGKNPDADRQNFIYVALNNNLITVLSLFADGVHVGETTASAQLNAGEIPVFRQNSGCRPTKFYLRCTG